MTHILQVKQPETEKRGRGANGTNDDILQALLVHEPQAGPSSSRNPGLPSLHSSLRPESSGEDSDADAGAKNGDGGQCLSVSLCLFVCVSFSLYLSEL